MQGAYRSLTWAKLARLRRMRRVQNGLTFGLVFLGPMLAVATFLAFGPLNLETNSRSLRLILKGKKQVCQRSWRRSRVKVGLHCCCRLVL